MSRWTELATWRGPTTNQAGPMVEQRGLVLHIAEGSFEGTIAWQKDPAAQVSSHFVVAQDGRIAQVVDTAVTAWTQQLGNGHWASVENEGHTPAALTPPQVEANAQLLARGHREHGWPLQIATTPSGRGLGHHSMGAESGIQWGHSDCPGPAIKAQKPAILARAIAIVNRSQEDAKMIRIAAVKGAGWYVGDGIWYRNIWTWPEHEDLIAAGAVEKAFAATDDWQGYVGRVQAQATDTIAIGRSVADALLARLPAGTMTREDLEQAVRAALDGSTATIHPAAQ